MSSPTGPPTISRAGSTMAPALAINGPSGSGKTSLAACFPKPIFLMVRDQGLLPLIDSGMVPATDHFDPAEALADVTGALDYLAVAEHDFRTLVIDGLSGLEQVLVEHVTTTQYNNDPSAFHAYGRGWDGVVTALAALLKQLDRLRRERKMAVLILAHSRVAPFANPAGLDYTRLVPDVKDKVWSLLHKWLDFFGHLAFDVEVKVAGGKAKGVGLAERVLYTEERPAFIAKNRYGLPPAIKGSGPGAGPLYAAFAAAIREAKSRRASAGSQTQSAEDPVQC